MADDSQKSGDPVDPETFLSRVNRLAKNPPSQSSFHRTRQPFVRLSEIVGRAGAGRGARHPLHCQAPGCAAPLTEGYHRRADGLTLCHACFRSERVALGVDDEFG